MRHKVDANQLNTEIPTHISVHDRTGWLGMPYNRLFDAVNPVSEALPGKGTPGNAVPGLLSYSLPGTIA